MTHISHEKDEIGSLSEAIVVQEVYFLNNSTSMTNSVFLFIDGFNPLYYVVRGQTISFLLNLNANEQDAY